MGGCMDRCMVGSMECIAIWMSGWLDGCMDRWMDMNGRMDGQGDGWMRYTGGWTAA